MCVPHLKLLCMGSPGKESTWGKQTGLMGLTRVTGWGRDPECSREAVSQTLPDGTRPCRSGGTGRRPGWEPDHTEGNTKGRCPPLSSPGQLGAWQSSMKWVCLIVPTRAVINIGADIRAYTCPRIHSQPIHTHDFSLRHIGSEAAEF